MSMKGTTICGVRRDGQIAIAGDGQVTMGEHTIFKGTAHKVRRIFNGHINGFSLFIIDFHICQSIVVSTICIFNIHVNPVQAQSLFLPRSCLYCGIHCCNSCPH